MLHEYTRFKFCLLVLAAHGNEEMKRRKTTYKMWCKKMEMAITAQENKVLFGTIQIAFRVQLTVNKGT